MVSILSYGIGGYRGEKQYSTMTEDEIFKEVEDNGIVMNVSRHLVLHAGYRKLYMDVEKIPFDDAYSPLSTIARLIIAMKLYLKLMYHISLTDDIECAVTFNMNSEIHSGFSYHIVFPEYCMKNDEMKSFILYFIHSPFGYEFADYIDLSVYKDEATLKLPYYVGINATKDGLSTDKNNSHKILIGYYDDFIIENVEDCIKLAFDGVPQMDWDGAFISQPDEED